MFYGKHPKAFYMSPPARAKEIIKSKLKGLGFESLAAVCCHKNGSNCGLNLQERDRMNKSFEALQQRVATQLDEANQWNHCVEWRQHPRCDRLRDVHLGDPNVEALSFTTLLLTVITKTNYKML